MTLLKTSSKKDNFLYIGSIIAAFVSMFIFFYVCHPLVILDADDWQYVSYTRLPIPYTGYWNPSRILPEILISLCGSAALVVYKIGILGYIESQVLIFGIVLSLFIAFYIAAFISLIRSRFNISMFYSCVLGGIFLSLHFLIFRKSAENNLYMFYSYDTCCYFYYTISALLNCTLVMYFDFSGILNNFFSRSRILWKIILLIIVYFAIFSNLFNSIILVAYLGVIFLSRLIETIIKKGSFSALIKKFALPLAIILLWLVAVYCEGHGGRAGNGASWLWDGFLTAVIQTAKYLPEIFSSFSISFYIIFFLAVCGIIFAIAKHLDNADNCRVFIRFIILQLFTAIVIIIFLVLLCAVVNEEYILRPQVMFGFIYTLFMIILAGFAYIIKYWKPAGLCSVIIFVFSVLLCNTNGVTYSPSNPMGLSENICISVDNDLIEQMVAADLSGTEKTYIYVMDTGVDDNWPHTAYIGYGLKQTLLKHGIIHRDFGIIPEMSTEFNERNGISVSIFWPRQYRAFYPTLF